VMEVGVHENCSMADGISEVGPDQAGIGEVG